MPATVGYRAYTGAYMGGSFTPNFGVAANQDDFAIVTMTNGSGTSYQPVAPSGWSTLVNDVDDGVMYALFYKKLSAGEAMPTFTTAGGAYNGQWSAMLLSKGDYIRNWTNALDYVYPSNSYINIPSLGGAVIGDRDVYWAFATRDYSGYQTQTYQVNGAASGFTAHTSSYGQGHAEKSVTTAGTQSATAEGGATSGGQQRYRVIRLFVAPVNTSPGAPASAPTITPNPVNTIGTLGWGAAVDPDGEAVTYDIELSTNNGGSWSAILTGVVGTAGSYNFSGQPSTTTAKLRVRARDSAGAYGPYTTMAGTFTIQHNVAPNAPTLTGPTNNAVVDRALTQRFSWTFSDPDSGDSQSKFDLQYRIGAGAWTTVSGTTPNNFYDFAPSSLAAGTYEWQVRTYDAQGVVGPWSASSFVTLANAPAAPAITAPVNGATIGAQTGTIAWSAPAQTSYQVRKVADNAGNPDTNTIYYDTGEVVSATARDAALDFPVNNRYEHEQVRIKYGGLWSSWSSVRVQIAYTPPPQITTILTPEPLNGRVIVSLLPPGANLISNEASSNFEDGTIGGWTSSQTGPSSSTDRAAIGSRSYKVTASNAADNNLGALTVTLPSAGTYTFSAKVYLPVGWSGGSVGCGGIEGGTATVSGGSTSSTRTSATGAWSTITFTFTTTTAGTVVFVVRSSNALTVGQTMYMDAVQVEVGNAASAYHPPSAPPVTTNEIWRKEVGPYGGSVKRIAVVSGTATYFDYAAASSVPLEYYIVSKGATGTSTTSQTYTTQLDLHGIWLSDPVDHPGTIHNFPWDSGRASMFEPEVALNAYVGRTFAVAEFGTTAKESVRLPLPLDDENGDRDAFQMLIRRNTTLLYRDGRGRKMFCILQSENMADTSYGGKVDFAAYSVDYSEAV